MRLDDLTRNGCIKEDLYVQLGRKAAIYARHPVLKLRASLPPVVDELHTGKDDAQERPKRADISDDPRDQDSELTVHVGWRETVRSEPQNSDEHQ